MTSATYALLRDALLAGRQVVCHYDGHRRELCPVVLGHGGGEEKVLAYQFGGTSRSGLPPDGEWRCLVVARITQASPRDGPWHEGPGHRRDQTCVETVDVDVRQRRRA